MKKMDNETADWIQRGFMKGRDIVIPIIKIQNMYLVPIDGNSEVYNMIRNGYLYVAKLERDQSGGIKKVYAGETMVKSCLQMKK